MLSATLLDTEKVWALTNAAIEPDWVIAELPHLLARRHFDPHWSRAQGRVLGSEQISLFGLVLAPKKPVHYGALFPEESARDLRARGPGDRRDQHPQRPSSPRNLATLAAAREEEAKLRRAGLVVDEDWQARWYLDRLPAGDPRRAGAGRLVREAAGSRRKRRLEWSRDDLLLGDEAARRTRFPKYCALGDARLPLHYRFEPGAEDDGMTLDVPLHLLNALDAGAAVVAGAGLRRRQGGGADQVPAQGAAPQLRAGAGLRPRVLRGVSAAGRRRRCEARWRVS